MEKEIQKILDRNFTMGDNAKALKELCVLFNIRERSEIDSEITRLQEKYDENGYEVGSLGKLKRMEQHIDASFKIWQDRFNAL